MARSNAKLVAERSKQGMTYFKTDLDIDKLRERPKNQKTEIAKLQAYIDCDLSHKAAQVFSAAWTDKNGVVLAVYFADRILENQHNLRQTAPPSSQASSTPCNHPLDSRAPTGAKVVRPSLFFFLLNCFYRNSYIFGSEIAASRCGAVQRSDGC